MRLIDADELITAFPCGESVRTESVRATINHMPTIEVSEDCVSREHLKSFGYINKGDFNSVETIREWIDNAPSVIPQPKEGEWIEDEYGIPHCSECDCINNTVYRNYCPNCGSRNRKVVVADTPQTEKPKWTKENCKGCKYNEYPYDDSTCFVRVCIDGNKYEPKQTDIHGITDCDFCKGKNCEDCEGGKHNTIRKM